MCRSDCVIWVSSVSAEAVQLLAAEKVHHQPWLVPAKLGVSGSHVWMWKQTVLTCDSWSVFVMLMLLEKFKYIFRSTVNVTFIVKICLMTVLNWWAFMEHLNEQGSTVGWMNRGRNVQRQTIRYPTTENKQWLHQILWGTRMFLMGNRKMLLTST